MKIIKIGFLASAALLSTNIAYAEDNYSKYFYVGTELGLSEPVVKSFVNKETKSKFRLKQSDMYGARVGYSFYPGMMIELSGTYQPKYGFTYVLPETVVATHPQFGPITISKTPGSTKVISNVYTINWIYELPEKVLKLKPYFILGAGVARITVKPTFTTTNDLVKFGFNKDFDYFRLSKSVDNCLAWQVGGGVSRDLSENFSVDLGAKLQVVNDIKLKYATYDTNTKSFVSQKPIKKTIGVGEFTIGFTFKIPVK